MDAMASMLANFGSFLIIKLCYLLTLLVLAFTTVVLMVLPLVADLTLAISAVFLPLCLAFYPISKDWALSAINALMSSIMVTVAVALFARIFLGAGGMLAKGAAKADAVAQSGDLWLALGAGLGMLVVAGIVLLLASSLPAIVSGIFAGASLSSSVKQASGMAGKGAEAYAKVSGAAAKEMMKKIANFNFIGR